MKDVDLKPLEETTCFFDVNEKHLEEFITATSQHARPAVALAKEGIPKLIFR